PLVSACPRGRTTSRPSFFPSILPRPAGRSRLFRPRKRSGTAGARSPKKFGFFLDGPDNMSQPSSLPLSGGQGSARLAGNRGLHPRIDRGQGGSVMREAEQVRQLKAYAQTVLATLQAEPPAAEPGVE